MKRIAAAFIALAMALSLAACSGGQTAADDAGSLAPAGPSTPESGAPSPEAVASGSQPGNPPETPEETGGTRVLVAYFSATGTTKGVAEKIAAGVGGDLYQITPAEPYTSADLNYNDSNSRSTIEMNDPAARPAISGAAADVSRYDVVFLGYPIWWGKAPRILNTFVESCDLSGKTIVPFCTSGSSGIGSSAADLQSAAGGASWLPGRRFGGSASQSEIDEWVSGLGLQEDKSASGNILVSFNGHTYTAALADNSSAEAFAEYLRQSGGSVTVSAHDYGSFEKVGPLGTSLVTNDRQTDTTAGDIILYQGSQIVLYYSTNSWSFTRLGRLEGDLSGLKEDLGEGNVDITYSISAQMPPASSSLPAEPSPEEPAPESQWRFDAPENHEMDPAVLADLHSALSGSTITSMVTVKDGVIIDEYYADGYDENSLFGVHSASKSFTSALLGIAIDEGYVDSIDDPLSKYLPRVLELEDTRKQQITLRHLLTHTSGLEWYEWSGSYSNWSEFQSAENWVEYILNRRLVQTPGAVFNYSTGNTHLLSAVLEAATGMSQAEYCRSRLFDPMGISESAHWNTDGQGITDGGNGLRISSRDAARFGQLFLNGGAWEGEQLVPAAWVEESTSVQNPGPGSTGQYGYQWWIQPYTTGAYGTHATPYKNRRFDTYFAFGYGGQFIYVVPELDMVSVFTCRGNSSYAPRPYFTDYVLNAYMGEDG